MMTDQPQPVGHVELAVKVRIDLRPGDVGSIIALHGVIHARECGFDPTFEAYVATPLAEFVRTGSPRERLWVAERGGTVVGCIAIVAASAELAQLRWFLVDPSARGIGLGKRLLGEALSFARQAAYRDVILWTVSTLATAAHLYRMAGFRKVEEKPGRMWGVDVVEEKYALTLG
jgi:GNAT superfamily N-acetyltransferase